MSRFIERLPAIVQAMQQQPELTLPQLAAIACCAPSHFQRLFARQFGLSVKRFQRLLTLDRAAAQLAFRAHKIIDIAYNAGFSSPEAFSRAFTDFIGQSPRSFRQQPDWLAWQQAIAALAIPSGATMFESHQVQVMQRQPTAVALLDHVGNPALLGHTIRNFIAFRKAHGLPPHKSATYNLLYQDPRFCEPADFRLGIACACEQVPSNDLGVVPAVIAGGWYGALEVKGDDQTFSNAVQWLCEEWVETAGYQVADAPLLVERRRFYPDVSADQAEHVIFVPLALG